MFLSANYAKISTKLAERFLSYILQPTFMFERPPNWKKIYNFMNENNNIHIEKGSDKTGNILSLENFVNINQLYGNTMDFITADGGFDFSYDYNNQENNMIKLLYGQIVYALCMQKNGGSFVLKIFDCFMKHTIELLFLLSSMYEEVYITKPLTSRSANSEKYIVCKNFIQSSIQLYPYLFFSFKEMLEKTDDLLFSFLDIEIPLYFLEKIELYNGLFGSMQLENIQRTLQLIEETNEENIPQFAEEYYVKHPLIKNEIKMKYSINEKHNKKLHKEIEILINENILKCVYWCIKHNIPTNLGSRKFSYEPSFFSYDCFIEK